MSAVQIQLNGAPRALPGPQPIAELIDELGFTGKRIAVELNGQIIPRSHYSEVRLRVGDRLEVVVAVGGG